VRKRWTAFALKSQPASYSRKIAFLLVACLLFLSGGAAAEFGFVAFDGSVIGDEGTPFTQAGGHPFAVRVSIDIRTRTKIEDVNGTPVEVPWPEEAIKSLFVDAPPGFVGNPRAVPSCTMEQLVSLPSGIGAASACPAETQVGVVAFRTSFGPNVITLTRPLYSLVPPPNVPARFGFNFGGVIVTLDASVRSDGDYGLTVGTQGISQGIALVGTEVTLWGVPGESAHDGERWCEAGFPGCPSTSGQIPFLTMPTSCTAPDQGLLWAAHADSWVSPGVFASASFLTHSAPFYPDADWPGPQVGVTGCELVPFRASLDAKPSSLVAGAPSGYAFDLTIPQSDDPITGLAPSHLKKVAVTLPPGVRVSPSSAAGLEGCSPAQIGLDNRSDVRCPDGSKIGSLRIDTPVLDEPLHGSVYLATPYDNPSRSLIALYLVAKGPGLIVKLPGSASPNPQTGQISATFDDNPQLPFSALHLEFNDGARAALSNPQSCATHTTHATLSSWSGKIVTSNSSFTTSADGRGAPCPRPHFTPTLEAGALSPVAGASSPFTLTLSRDDQDDEFAAIRSLEMPKGLLARISDIDTLCPDAQARAGTCGEASRIGTVTTAAGPGPSPFAVRGSVYLGDAYKGAPFSLAIVVPVKAGPFDLGTVVIRSAIFFDRHTAELDIVTDPLPTILEGIPLQVRLVNVLIDRPGFMVNPTNCKPKRISAEVQATTGRVATPSVRFQVGNCGSLDFEPRLSLRVGKAGATQAGRSTPLIATLRMPRGHANIGAVSVSLPRVLNARLPVVNSACTPAQYEANDCARARVGSAVAVSPLLDEPLRGSAYFVRNRPRGLPDLVVALRGQVDFDLVGRVTIPRSNRLGTMFNPPDVPVSRFTLKLTTGRNGPVGTAENLCTRKARRATARVIMRGQNGDAIRSSRRLEIRGC
jgi:hypothetical protein